MSIENPLLSFKEKERSEREKVTEETIDRIVVLLLQRKELLNPFVIEYFKDPDLFYSLPDEIRENSELLSGYVLNSSRFGDSIHNNPDLYGPMVHLPESAHEDGRARRAEDGPKIQTNSLTKRGVDSKKVLFFRVTQPAEIPKPEYYWTSDYFETQRGLRMEITSEKRKTAIVLVADLDTINANGGLIADINDDQGLAVRQIGQENFDQKLALAQIRKD